MRAFALLPLIGYFLILVVVPVAARTGDRPLALRGATIIDIRDGTLHPDQAVVIHSGRIASLGPSGSVSIPRGAQVIDAREKYLIPGLWDMHVHSAANTALHFPLFVAHGVTGVRNMHSTVDTALALTRAIRRRLAAGELLGPRFVANGPIVDGSNPAYPGTLVVRSEGEARAAVDSLVAGGADFIKVYDSLSREAYFAILNQAQRRGVPVAGHVPYRIRAEEAAAAGQSTDEHMIGFGYACSSRADSVRAERVRGEGVEVAFPESLIEEFRLSHVLLETRDLARCAAAAATYREHGVAVLPNLFIQHDDKLEVLEDSARMRFVPASVHDDWQRRAGPGPGEEIRSLVRQTYPVQEANVRMLRDAGVMILAGTDLGNPFLLPGISMHQELALLVRAGLSPLEALQSATLNPARYLGATDSLGTVEAGKLADLVLLDGNPLEDIRNTQEIAAVVLNGRYLDRAALDALLAEAERAATAPAQ